MKKELDVDSETDTERCLCGWTQRVVVNGSHSAWRPVSNSWSLLGLVLFNFCVDALKEEMESVLSILSGDAKPMGPVDTGQGWITTKGWGLMSWQQPDGTQQGQMPCTWERRAFCSATGWALRDSGAALWPMYTASSGSNKGQEHPGLYEESSSPRKRIFPFTQHSDYKYSTAVLGP